MTQQSFDFGPSHNTRNPATDTSSSAGIDDLISKLGSMLSLTPKSNDNLAEILKKAVKEGIEEAQKSDARTDDSEERAAERHHKEIVNELKRIASLGGGKGHGGGSDTDEKKKDDGLSITDIMKWGLVAGGIATLVSNLNLLGDSFTDTTNRVLKFKNDVGGFLTDADKFKDRLGELSKDAFSESGFIGMLIGAFGSKGILGKIFGAVIGSAVGGQVGNVMGLNNPQSPSGSPGGSPGGSPSQQWGVNYAGVAGAAWLGKGGGSITNKAIRAFLGYELGEHLLPSYTERGEKKQTLTDRILGSGIRSGVVQYNDDGTLTTESKEGFKGAAVGGLGAMAAATRANAARKVLGAAPISGKAKLAIGGISAIVGMDFMNDDVSILDSLGTKFDLSKVKNMIGLGEPAHESQYDKKIREYDEAIEKLKLEYNSGMMTRAEYDKDRPRNRIKVRERRETFRANIKELQKQKDDFISSSKEQLIGSLREKVSGLEIDPRAGNRGFLESDEDKLIVAGAGAWAGGVALMSAPVTFGTSAVAAPVAAATASAYTAAGLSAITILCNAVEKFMDEELQMGKHDFLSIAFSEPNTALKILKLYYDAHTTIAIIQISAVAVLNLVPTKAVGALIKVAKAFKSAGFITEIAVDAGKAAGIGKGVKGASGFSQIFKGPTAVKFNFPVGAGLAGDALKVGAVAGGVVAGVANTNLYPDNDTFTPLQSPYTPANIPGGGAALPTDNTKNDSSGSWGNVFGDMANGFSGGSPTTIPQNPVNAPQGNSPTTFNGKPLTHDMFKGDNRTFDNHNFVNDGLTTVIKTNNGTQVEVATNRASQFLGFLNELEGKGYKIRVTGGLGNRHGSTTTPKDSLHNLGLAIDINPRENPYAKREGAPLVTDMGNFNVGEMARRYGLKWGGEWDRPDAMHFEVDKSLRTAEEDNKNIANSIFAKRAMGLTGNTSQNPMGDLIGQILRTESHGNPNAFWGDKSGKYDDLLGEKQLSQMTFAELREFQKKLTARTRGFDPKHPDKGTSAAGIGQWVGSTLFGKNYDDTGFLKDYFGGKNYENEVFSLDRQKDMFKSFLKSKKYGNLEGFLGSNMSSEAYATQLGNQWQGVQNPEEKQRLIATLDKLKKSPHANIDKELDNLMAQMDSLVSTSDKFNNAMGDVGKAVKSALSSLGDFFKNIMEEAPKLLPDELKALVDMPGVLDFLEPLFGGESRSTLAHPTRTLEKGDILKVKSMILGKSVEELQAMESAKLNNVEITPLTNGNDLLYTSKRVADNKSRANNNYLGDIINMTAAQTHQGESVKGNIFNGAGGYTDTHHPGDRDAFAINIYSYGDGPAFYNSGGTGPFGF